MVSRQREWQLRKRAEGRCQGCGKKRHPASAIYCFGCHVKARLRTRRRLGRKPYRMGEAGCVPIELKAKHRAFTVRRGKRIVRLYESGLTVTQVAARMGCSSGTVYQRLKDAGCPLRKGPGQRRPRPKARTAWQKANRSGFSAETVS